MAETIFALSTLMGKSGVSVIRISGEHALDALFALGFKNIPVANKVYVSKIFFPSSNEILDEGIVIYFKAPGSFTGEDVVELHLHGSIAVISDAISALSQLKFLRPAEAGEFTKRAFLNNKIDLTKAEGLSLLIDAETSIQRKVAINQLQGSLESLYDKWRGQLISILAKIEAFIDFPDDEIPDSEVLEANSLVDNLVTAIENHLADGEKGEVVFKGIRVAIIGAPNVGKSSLLNILAKREVAIVSDQAGTTRDVIEVRTSLDGYPVTFFDTAGIRETTDKIETEGIKRALHAVASSDISVIMFANNIEPEMLNIIKNSSTGNLETIIVMNKIDIYSYKNYNLNKFLDISCDRVIELSAKTGYGIEKFLDVLLKIIKNKYHFTNEPIITKARYRKSLNECLVHLKEFSMEKPLELAAEDLRLAAHYLGCITGRIDVEEVLDDIFSNFCIGK